MNWQVIEPPPKTYCCLSEFQRTRRINTRTVVVCRKCKTEYTRQPNGTWKAMLAAAEEAQ